MRRDSLWQALFRPRPLSQLQADADADTSLRRVLGPFDLMMLGVGAMLGTGVYVLAGRAAAQYAGPAVIVSFILAGLAASLAALCYAEMASMIPVAGSAYTYTYATMGELTAFLIGWDLLLEYLMGASLVATGWSGYFCAFVGRLGWALPAAWTSAPVAWNEEARALTMTGAYVNLPAFLLCGVLTTVLILGVKQSAKANNRMVMVKFAVVLLFIIFAVPHIKRANFQPFVPPNQGTFGHFGLSGIFQCITILYLGFIGFDAVCTAAQETRAPQRNIPLGILGAMAGCTILYVIIATVLVGIVPYTQLNVPHPLAVGIAATEQPWLEMVIEAGAVVGLASNALVMLLGQPRILYTMARDGLLPSFATRISPRFGTPVFTTCLAGALCALLSGLLPIDVIGELCSIGTLFAFALVSLGVMILRIKQPEAKRRFRVLGGPYVLPLASTLISLGLMLTANVATLMRLFVWMLLGLVVYFTYSRRNSTLCAASLAASSGFDAAAEPSP